MLETPEPKDTDDRLQSVIMMPQDQIEQPGCSEIVEVTGLDNGAGSFPLTEPSEGLILNEDILEILGVDPTTNTKLGKDVNKDLAVRLQHYSTTGLSKDMRKELGDKYLVPGNCKFIDAPQLNAEIKAALTEQVAKRDKSIELRQKQIATALSCLSDALTNLFASTT